MNAEPIGIGIIGCGAISQRRHLPEYAADCRCRIIGCTDYSDDRAKSVAQAYSCEAFSSVQALLDDPRVQAVSICTSNDTHASLACQALRCGKHVLCEKPMAVSAQEAANMISVARECGKMLICAMNQRLFPGHKKARELLDSGILGRVLSFDSRFCHAGPEGWSADGAKSWFFDPAKAGNGVIGDLAVHKFDVIEWLLHDRVSTVFCQAGTLLRRGSSVWDDASIVLQTEAGVSGTIHVSWCNRGAEENQSILYCENGCLEINTQPGDDLVVTCGKDIWRFSLGGIPTNDAQSCSGVISAFLDALCGGAPFADAESGLRAALFTDACALSLKSGTHIEIS